MKTIPVLIVYVLFISCSSPKGERYDSELLVPCGERILDLNSTLTQAILDGQELYITEWDSSISKYNIENKKLVWKVKTHEIPAFGFTKSDSLLFFIPHLSSSVHCYSTSGNFKWKLKDINFSHHSTLINSPSSIIDISINSITAINKSTGQKEWSINLKNTADIYNSSIDNPFLFLGNVPHDGIISCINVKSGAFVWSKKFEGKVASDIKFDDENLYFSIFNRPKQDYILRILKANGELTSKYLTDDPYHPILVDSLAIYFHNNRNIKAVGKDNGNELWNAPYFASHPKDFYQTNEFLFVDTDSSQIISKTDGRQLCSIPKSNYETLFLSPEEKIFYINKYGLYKINLYEEDQRSMKTIRVK